MLYYLLKVVQVVVKCNVCGSPLKKSGYPSEFWQHYECPNGCAFTFPLHVKLLNWLEEALVVIFTIILAAVIFQLKLIKKIGSLIVSH
jgi:hypothetical protein